MHINIQATLEKNPMKMYIKQLSNINNILETGTQGETNNY